MEVEVVGTDVYGDAAYKSLFEGIIGDIGKTFMIEGAKLILKISNIKHHHLVININI